MRSINIKIDGKEYVLGYNLASIKKMSKNGFQIENMRDSQMASVMELFEGAFLMNHSDMTEDEIFGLLPKIKGKMKLYGVLAEMYADTLKDFIDDDEEDGESKNLNWGIIDR